MDENENEKQPGLVLSRKVGQKILIGDDIEVEVLRLKGGQVKIGVRAPNNVAVHRQEVYDEIHRKPNE